MPTLKPNKEKAVPVNIFSNLIKDDVSNFRRVRHSFGNYFSSIDRSSFGFSNSATQVVDKASLFAGTAGGVAGAVVIGMGEAAVAGIAGAGFLAACAGPQVAITAAVVGLALFVKGTYSNRESAHKELLNFSWNLVDDVPPTKGVLFTDTTLKEACDAATTLLDDGKSQIKLLGSKLQAAQTKFNKLNQDIEAAVIRYQTETVALAGLPPTVMQNRSSVTNPAIALTQAKLAKMRTEVEGLWAKESKPGGAIFEYVRRCSHTSNYLQAPHLVALAMREKFNPGSVIGKPQPDYFTGSVMATQMRESFTKLELEYAKCRVVP